MLLLLFRCTQKGNEGGESHRAEMVVLSIVREVRNFEKRVSHSLKKVSTCVDMREAIIEKVG